MEGPTMEGEVVDVTSHSTNVPWRQKIVTLLNAGNLAIPLFFIPTEAGHSFSNPEGLGYVFTHRQERWYRFTFADATPTIWYIRGYISTFNLTAPVAGVYTAQVTFEWTSQPIFA
jgi:hypothetical protein